MVEVAVIGAGAAGLVASRHLLRCGLSPCIFESSSSLAAAANSSSSVGAAVGGAWNSANSRSYKMWDNLKPNLSRYSCVFSDWPWSEMTAASATAAAATADEESSSSPSSSYWHGGDNNAVIPTFPTRTDMCNYLDQYSTRYIDPGCFRYGCTVTNVSRRRSSSNAGGGTTNSSSSMGSGGFRQPFQVEWSDQKGESHSRTFDGVIVATGFFQHPVLPDGLLEEDEGLLSSERAIHSSQYRSPNDFCNQTVAVCGSSFSALEIAADVRKRAAKVVSVLPRVPYVVPRYVPVVGGGGSGSSSNAAASAAFAPLDTLLYRRARDAPQVPAAIELDAESCRAKHSALRSLLGGARKRLLLQSALGISTADDDDTYTSSPPLLAISDDYLNLVIDGNIDVVKGRLKKATRAVAGGGDDVDDHEDSPASASSGSIDIELEDGQVISGIDRIIACTGYRSRLSNLLEADILETLEYDENDGYSPLTLCYDAFHPDLPGLGFVGMYKGPHFGPMELQARLLAGLFSGQVSPSEESVKRALEESRRIRDPGTPRAQFPRHDYIGFMDSMAEQLDLVPSGVFGAKGAVVSPAFYQPSEEIARQCKDQLDQELQPGGGSANMAKIALNALIGKWDFERTITHFSSPSDPPQRVTGDITFSHIPPPKRGEAQHQHSTKDEWDTVLYHENGIFHLAGKELEVFREYEYEYKDNGILEIYFVELGKRAHLFLSLKFTKTEDGYWVATSDHLCIKDLYSATFKIAFDGIEASEVIMAYRVRGPAKDYEAVTTLRPSPQ